MEGYETSNTIRQLPEAEMDTQELPSDFHPQDWIIIVEALAQWAGPPDEAKGRRERERERAYELIDGIAFEQGIEPSELVLQGGSNDTVQI